ncbi:MAG: hypothetical protein DRZ82_08945 [Thermoprotei archaeon]|nr:MAG: hypothetical protein DRZ82_08945 [Thermoprotei archaeon]
MAYEICRAITFFGYFILLLSLFSLIFGSKDSASIFLLSLSIIISILLIVISVLVATGRLSLPIRFSRRLK